MSIENGAWSGKSAVVVGASAGLGCALAEELAREGAGRLVLVARGIERLQQLGLEFTQSWPATQTISCAADVTTAAGAHEVANAIGSSLPSLDLLINAVGRSDRGTALKLLPERIEELMHANVYGPLRVVQAVRSQLHSGSVIVNIGSLSSHFAPRHLGGYSIAKHGLRALTQQLRLELREHGIHVMLACPGPIARTESGSRYASLASAGDIPAEALHGGGGAKLKGLEQGQLARDILRAASMRQLELIRPRKARWLIWLVALCPSWGELVLRRMTG